MVTHLSTNWAWHGVTSLIETNKLPLSQAATKCTSEEEIHTGWSRGNNKKKE